MSINHHRGFSLVEVLAAVAIIGIITFLAMPNIVAVKQDSENNLAISRAEAINIALVTFIQTNGHNNATNYWNQSSSDQHRYLSSCRPYGVCPCNYRKLHAYGLCPSITLIHRPFKKGLFDRA